MRKIYALFINEMIKISKKLSVVIILGLTVVLIFAYGGILKFAEYASKSSTVQNMSQQADKERMNSELQSLKGKLDEVQKGKSSATGLDLQNLQLQEVETQNNIDMIQYYINNKIASNSDEYRSQAVSAMFSNKLTVSQLGLIPAGTLTTEQMKLLNTAKANIPRYQKVIDNKDFKEFIAISNDEIKNTDTYSEEEKKVFFQSNELRLTLNLTGEKNSSSYSVSEEALAIRQIENGKRSLLGGFDLTANSQGKLLTQKRREEIKNNVDVLLYKLKNGITTSTNGNDVDKIAFSSMTSAGTFMIILLLMILAGGAISSEISSGSIKSLIISPTKRWKILTAKILALLTVGIIGELLVFVFVVLANGLFFGFNNGDSYIFASNGSVYDLNFYLYQIAKLGTDFVPIACFMVFALMLSVITRNTAASVGVSIGVYFVGNIATAFLLQISKGEWQKFNPFNNLDISSKVFTNDAVNQMVANAGGTVNTSLTFTLLYVTILIFIMGFTSFDSFLRRDIR